MKQITRILALSALVLVALFAALTFALPSNELSISFPEGETESSVSGEAERPAAPVLMAATDVGLVTITWQPVADAATYEIWMRHSDTAWEQIDDGSLTTTSFTHTGFTSDATYSYTGRAVSASGQKSPWAPQVHATVSATLAAPVLIATAGPGQISLDWQLVTGADSYELWAWESAAGWQQLDDGSLTNLSFTHSGLTAGATYFYTVRALSAAGAQSPWSEQVPATVTVAMAAPVLTATPGLGEVTISWQPVTNAASYELWMRHSDTAWRQIDDGSLTDTSLTHDGLTTGMTYSFTGRAVSASGHKSSWAPQVDVTVSDTLAAPVLTATGGVGQIALTWQPVSGADSYELWAWENAAGWQQLDDGSLIDTSLTHSELTAGSTYFYSLRALSADGQQSQWSEQVHATVTAALAAPVLTATAAAGQITLTWQPVSGADTYELWAWEDAAGWQRLDDGALTGTSFIHSGPTAGTTYYYHIRALAADGAEGPWSERVDATP